MSQVSTLTVKLAGTVMLGFGIGLAILALWMVERRFALHRASEISTVVVITVLVIISVFCSLVGYRLLFNRPNRHGTLLSPLAWRILAGFFWLSGLGLGGLTLAHGDFRALFGIACLGVLGYCCLMASRGETFKPLSSTAFTPETSLVGVEGFLPPGFECGIEILNDDQTPMQFVVSMLRDSMGMTEEEAIRVMLDIHQKGGVLLATPTPEEATRIADSITSEARGRNHPLVCRAVNAAQRGSSGQ
jgi:ATP-dependent Clp protease adapter protein ClpS